VQRLLTFVAGAPTHADWHQAVAGTATAGGAN